MNFREFGILLFVERYIECVTFYKDVLRLEVRKEKENLVSFNISGGYLMVEKDGVGSTIEKSREQNPVVLRFDVDSLSESVKQLKFKRVTFLEEHLAFDWGTIAVLLDPDSNRIELGEVNETSGSY